MKRNFTLFLSNIFFLLALQLCCQQAMSQTITTIAGGGSAAAASDKRPLPFPVAIAFDASGNLYVSADSGSVIRKIAPDKTVTTVAGGHTGTVADGTDANSGRLLYVASTAFDAAGNLYFSETKNFRVRKIDMSTGIVSTVAGNGSPLYTGDGTAKATGMVPGGIAFDASGNLLIADYSNNGIRKLNLESSTISTIAGTGVTTYNGDNQAATAANLDHPTNLAVDGSGNIFIAEEGGNRVRMINTSGIISTYAGNGQDNSFGDNGPATAAGVRDPTTLGFDTHGNLYIVSYDASTVRMVDKATGVITTVAGAGQAGYGGDNGPATSALLNHPGYLAFNGSDDYYIADFQNHRIRKVSAGTITTIAGNGAYADNGDGGPATEAIINSTGTIAVDRKGNIYVPDSTTIRKITPAGIVTTIAGNGVAGFSGEGVPALQASLNMPFGIYVDPAGVIYVGTLGDHHIRRIDTSGIITTIAGNGTGGYSGDGGPATAASINGLQGITGDAKGNLYFTDFRNGVARKINASGTISTFAGTGVRGNSGDGGPATSARLWTPTGISMDAFGNIYIADDSLGQMVRKVDTLGIISTIAGSFTGSGDAGDGGAATAATFGDIEDVYSDALGDLYIVDAYRNRIRRVNAATGIVTAFAGTGVAGYSGDGGAALSAQMKQPWSIAADTAGNFYVNDALNNVIRKISVSYPLVTTGETVTQNISNSYATDVNDNNLARLLTITPTAGANALSGITTFAVNFDASVNTYNGQPYVQRHYDITPAANAATAQAMVTLYFLQSEFDAYNTYVTANHLALPLLPSGGTDNGNVNITQFHGTGTAPGNYTGTELMIKPAVSWDGVNNRWALTFPVNGFSGFYVTTGSDPLPLTLIRFEGVYVNAAVHLTWQTSHQLNVKEFRIERSADNGGFVQIGTVAATDKGLLINYRFDDRDAPSGTSYYRLKMVDADGSYTYSPIISVKLNNGSTNKLYPNPAHSRLSVSVSSESEQSGKLMIVDMLGHTVQQQQVQLHKGGNNMTLNITGLPRGNYLLLYSGEQQWQLPFMKQ